MKTVEDMLREALLKMGADGLCLYNGECGCSLSDLAPCSNPDVNCMAARKVENSEDEDHPNGRFITIGEYHEQRKGFKI